jgi:hypothetical protein
VLGELSSAVYDWRKIERNAYKTVDEFILHCSWELRLASAL